MFCVSDLELVDARKERAGQWCNGSDEEVLSSPGSVQADVLLTFAAYDLRQHENFHEAQRSYVMQRVLSQLLDDVSLRHAQLSQRPHCHRGPDGSSTRFR